MQKLSLMWNCLLSLSSVSCHGRVHVYSVGSVSGGFLFFFFLSCPHHYFSASRLERQFEHTHADPEGHGDIYNFSMSKIECVFFCTSVPPIFDWNRIVCVFLSANGE